MVLILILGILFIPLGLILIKKTLRGNSENESYKNLFYQELMQENFYFSGTVSSTEIKDHGGGFICLENIESNKPPGYKFMVEGNFVASVEKNKIMYLGIISIVNIEGFQDKLRIGDSISYNRNKSKKILFFRNNKLIYENEAFVYKVHYNHQYLHFACE